MAGQIRHLLNREGRYYARLRVPADVRDALGVWELREPLGADRAAALRKLPETIARLQRRIDVARGDVKADAEPVLQWPRRRMTTQDVMRTHYTDELRSDAASRDTFAADRSPDGVTPGDFNATFLPGYADALARIAGGYASPPEIDAALGWALEGFAARGNIDLRRGSPEWHRFARTLAGVHRDVLERVRERDRGDFTGQAKHPALTLSVVPAKPEDPLAARIIGPDSTKPVGEIATAYLAARQAKPSTNYEYEVLVRMLGEHFTPSKAIYTFTRADVRSFRDALSKLPTNYLKRFPGRTMPEAIEANDARRTPFPRLAPKTVNEKYLSSLHALFAWAVKNDVIPDNPAAGIKVDAAKATSKPRVHFTPDDLTRIVAAPLFDAAKPFGEMQWAILLALYTGARASELAQVKLDSVRHERGVLVINIEEETKTVGSQRLVPVHTALLGIGFEDRVAKLRKAGATHLFPEWYGQGIAAKQAAQAKAGADADKLPLNLFFPRFIPRRFNVSVLPNAKIADSRKTFHSLRHTFKTGLSLAGVDKPTRDLLCGHTDYSAGAGYVHAHSVEKMREAIELLGFDGLDLSLFRIAEPSKLK